MSPLRGCCWRGRGSIQASRFRTVHSSPFSIQGQLPSSALPAIATDSQEFVPGARVSATSAPASPGQLANAPPSSAWSRPLSRAQTPPSSCLCCHHVAGEGPDVTMGGTAQTQKRGRGDSTCCVAAREPDTVVLRPCRFQSPDHVSLSRAAAALAQQQQQLRGRGAAPAAARWPQQFLGGATHEQQQ